MDSIVNSIEHKRLKRGISVAELARRCEIDRKRLWYVLNEQREMRVDEFLKLCIVLRLDPRNFVTREMIEEVAEATKQSIGLGDDLST